MRMYSTAYGAYRRMVSPPVFGDTMGFFDTSGKHPRISSAEQVVWSSLLETLAFPFPHPKHDAPKTSILRRALPCSLDIDIDPAIHRHIAEWLRDMTRSPWGAGYSVVWSVGRSVGPRRSPNITGNRQATIIANVEDARPQRSRTNNTPGSTHSRS